MTEEKLISFERLTTPSQNLVVLLEELLLIRLSSPAIQTEDENN